MAKCLKILFVVVLPVVVLYTVCGYLVTGSPVQNIWSKFLLLLEQLGLNGNFWLSLSEYYNTVVSPAFSAVFGGSDVLTWFGSLFTLLTIPISLGFYVIDDFIGFITTLLSFLTFKL